MSKRGDCPLESAVERWLGKQAKAAGVLYYKFVSPGEPGVPDRMMVFPDGRIVFVELKRDHMVGHTQAIQDWQIDRLKTHGAKVEIVYGMDEAHAFTEKYLKG